jgi:hypothetical protein
LAEAASPLSYAASASVSGAKAAGGRLSSKKLIFAIGSSGAIVMVWDEKFTSLDFHGPEFA